MVQDKTGVVRSGSRPVDLDDVVTGVGRRLARVLGDGIILRIELAGDLWPVLADPGLIEQALVNLAGNAREAMTGAGAVSIDTANIVADPDFVATGPTVLLGRYVRLRVADTRGRPASPRPERAGLGLSTVYGIVAQADATVDVQSRPGGGTTFTILIPAAG